MGKAKEEFLLHDNERLKTEINRLTSENKILNIELKSRQDLLVQYKETIEHLQARFTEIEFEKAEAIEKAYEAKVFYEEAAANLAAVMREAKDLTASLKRNIEE